MLLIVFLATILVSVAMGYVACCKAELENWLMWEDVRNTISQNYEQDTAKFMAEFKAELLAIRTQ